MRVTRESKPGARRRAMFHASLFRTREVDMLRSGGPMGVLTIAALAARVLTAQTPTDLTQVCKAVGDAKPGQWASFDATNGGSEAGKLRLAVVGSERAGDTTLYWFEVSFLGKDPGRSGVVQILDPNLAAGMAAPHGLIVKMGGRPAMKIPGSMAGIIGQDAGEDASPLDSVAPGGRADAAWR